MHSCLITGANRGLGLELVKQLLAHKTGHPQILIAAVRDVQGSTALLDIKKKDKRLTIMKLDLNDTASFPAFVKEVEKTVGPKGLTVLINNAAIQDTKIGTLETVVNAEMLTRLFHTNTIAPILLTQACLPLLKKSAYEQQLCKEKFGIKQAAIIYISSILGSVANNGPESAGGFWGYRQSKAALNMAARTITIEVKKDGIAVLVLHPGWVKTRMGGMDAAVTPETSVAGLVKVMLALDEKTNGLFLDYTGAPINW